MAHCRQTTGKAASKFSDSREGAKLGAERPKWRHRDSNPGHADYDSAALTN